MDQFDDTVHSFLLRIWLEEIKQETQDTKYRGHIINVATGERRYFEHFWDATDFISKFLYQVDLDVEREEE